MKTSLIYVAFAGAIMILPGTVSADDMHGGGVRQFDLDGNGNITRAEFDEVFDAKMNRKVDWLDVDKDGVVSPEEFRQQHEAEYDQRWNLWDEDNDGVVSVVEAQQKQHARRMKEGAGVHK
jgi:Ca2+-binding EF-hand superfamily protein